MIHYNPDTRTFNLLTAHSYYAFRIEADGRARHLGWGSRPRGATEADLTTGHYANGYYPVIWSFYTEFQPDEVLTFGDTATQQETLKVSFPAAATDTAPRPIRDLRLRYAGHEIVEDAAPGLSPAHQLPVLNMSPRRTLRLRLADPVQPFAVVACYRLTPEHDIIERWLEIENNGPQTVEIETCNFAGLHLPNGAAELTAVHGGWSREFQATRETLPVGTRFHESRALQTGHTAGPFFMINRPGQAWEESGEVYFGALVYSGAWRISYERLPSRQVRVHAGYNPSDFELRLGPGERHVTPALLCGLSPDGWGGASRRLHAYARERLAPRSTQAPPRRPVLYNSWEATYFNISYDNQAELARKAAAIGVELFCLDDGWFGARSGDAAGLGDWTVRREAFPDGLEALVAEVHRLGMRFGLWVEPEMVNPDSDLYRAHPDWVLHFPGRPRTEARNQLILDFGRPEVVEHIFSVLDDLVGRYSVSFFKWDMNRYASEPGSVAGKAIWRKHTEGAYRIMDRLRRRHPGLDIQSCSGGGGRIDLGILGRVDQVWTSDNTDAFDRLHIQEGFSLAYPARAMEAWVTNVPNDMTGRSSPLSLRFDVAMRGVLGIGSSLNRLSDDELAQYAAYISFYKRIRHVVQEGALYRLQRLEEGYGSSVIEYVLPDGSEAVYSVALERFEHGSYRPAAALRGLVPGAMYGVEDVRGREVYRLSGYELMTTGMPTEIGEHNGYSRTLWVKMDDR